MSGTFLHDVLVSCLMSVEFGHIGVCLSVSEYIDKHGREFVRECHPHTPGYHIY